MAKARLARKRKAQGVSAMECMDAALADATEATEAPAATEVMGACDEAGVRWEYLYEFVESAGATAAMNARGSQGWEAAFVRDGTDESRPAADKAVRRRYGLMVLWKREAAGG